MLCIWDFFKIFFYMYNQISQANYTQNPFTNKCVLWLEVLQTIDDSVKREWNPVSHLYDWIVLIL